MTIQILPKQFKGRGEVKGYLFTFVFFSGKGYIYSVKNNLGQIHYEVFRHKTTPILLDWATQTYSENEEKVRYPKSNDFGKWAWTCQTIEAAKNRLQSL